MSEISVLIYFVILILILILFILLLLLLLSLLLDSRWRSVFFHKPEQFSLYFPLELHLFIYWPVEIVYYFIFQLAPINRCTWPGSKFTD